MTLRSRSHCGNSCGPAAISQRASAKSFSFPHRLTSTCFGALQSRRLNAPNGEALFASFRNFPVEYLLVRKGTIRLSEDSNRGIIVGEELAGRIGEDDRSVFMELRGTMASKRRNFFCSATFSKTGQKHRVSLRLDKAQIQKPLRIMKAEITSGMIDGVFEFSFPDSVSAATFESTGWVHVSRGRCVIDGVKSPLTSIGLMASLSNTVWRIDSLKCGWNGAVFRVRVPGIWQVSHPTARR